MFSTTCLIFSILVTVQSSQNVNLYRSDYKYWAEADGWLKLHRIPAKWKDAERKCHLEGAVLLSPLDLNLRNVTKNLMKEIPQCGVYTGIHATISKLDYYSVEGIPLHEIPIEWAPDEPDNFEDSEQCLMMLTNGTMADVNCDTLFPYICFKKKISKLFINGCGTTDSGYSYNAEAGSCYKFHRVGRTWFEAFSICASEGGHLAIINSNQEADALKELFQKNPVNVIQGNIAKDVFHIGFHDWGFHGHWRTIHGETLEQAGYDIWNPGQPDNATDGEFCGAVFRNAKLDDIWCDRPYAFVCEINV